MATEGNDPEWSLAIFVWFLRINIAPFGQLSHHPLCPGKGAHLSGVRVQLTGLSGLDSSRARSRLTTPACPLREARWSCVRPWISGLSWLTSFLVGSSFCCKTDVLGFVTGVGRIV